MGGGPVNDIYYIITKVIPPQNELPPVGE